MHPSDTAVLWEPGCSKHATDDTESWRDVQAYYGAHGHKDGIWVAAEDLHYFDDARERIMVYPGAPVSRTGG